METLHAQLEQLEEDLVYVVDDIEGFFNQAEKLMNDARDQGLITDEEYCTLEEEFGF